MWTRRKLKEQAKEALQRNYWKIVLVSVLLLLLGCEAGGYNFSAKLFRTESETKTDNVTQAFEAEEHIVKMTEEYPPGEIVAEAIGRGEKTLDDFTVDLFGGILFGMVAIVIFMAVFVIAFAVVLLVDLFLINPFDVGGKRFMRLSVEGTAQVKEITYGFDHSYKNVVKVLFFRDLYIFLWTLLLIVPGIIKMYEYLMVPYILTEYPDMEYHAALQMSRDMMDGNKWRAFVLGLSFILWDFLGAVTLGLLEVLYVQPYRNLTFAALYCQLKNTYVMNWAERMPAGQYGMNGQYGAYGQNGAGTQNDENGHQW